jgi:hypothetical protein
VTIHGSGDNSSAHGDGGAPSVWRLAVTLRRRALMSGGR